MEAGCVRKPADSTKDGQLLDGYCLLGWEIPQSWAPIAAQGQAPITPIKKVESGEGMEEETTPKNASQTCFSSALCNDIQMFSTYIQSQHQLIKRRKKTFYMLPCLWFNNKLLLYWKNMYGKVEIRSQDWIILFSLFRVMPFVLKDQAFCCER